MAGCCYKRHVKKTGIYIQYLVYVAHIAGHFTDHSVWWQTGKQSLLFKPSARMFHVLDFSVLQ
jgi:hypothetical protein